MTGRRMKAAEVLGIVDEVVEGSATDRAQELARSLVAGPRMVIRAIKEAVDQSDRATGMRLLLEGGPG